MSGHEGEIKTQEFEGDLPGRRVYYEYDPNVAGVGRVCKHLFPKGVPGKDSDIFERIGYRLATRRLDGQAKDGNAYLLFGSRVSQEIYATIKAGETGLPTLQLTIDHPREFPVNQAELMLIDDFNPLVNVSYDTEGRINTLSIDPQYAPLPEPEELEEAVEQIKVLLDRELVLDAAGIKLNDFPLHNNFAGLQGISERIMGMSTPPEIVPKSGQPTKSDKVEALTERAINLIYPQSSDNADLREKVLSIFEKMKLNSTWEALLTPVQFHDPQDIQALGRIYTRPTLSDFELMQEVRMSLEIRRQLWSRQYALQIERFRGQEYEEGEGLQYIVGDYERRMYDQEVKFAGYDTLISPLKLEGNENLPNVGYGYKIQLARDKKGRAKVFVAVYLDGSFAYRTAFPLQLDMTTILPTFDRANVVDYGELDSLVEYSRNPLS